MNILFLFGRRTTPDNLQTFQSKLDDFFQYAQKKFNLNFYITYIEAFDEEKKLFSYAFTQENSSWKIKYLLKPDIVYDKTCYFLPQKNLMKIRENISLHFKFLNPLEFNRILTDKWETYLTIPDIHPKTILFQENDDPKKIFDIPSSMIVVKPRDGFGGKDVTISTKEDFKPIKTPFIVQEFIETASGIPKITSGRHDLRIFLENEVPFYSIIRTPLKDPYLANIKRGGTLEVVPLEKIPPSAFEIVHTITKIFSCFPKKLYAVDLVFDKNQRPWVVECNSRPGIALHPNEIPYREHYYDRIINFLIKSI